MTYIGTKAACESRLQAARPCGLSRAASIARRRGSARLYHPPAADIAPALFLIARQIEQGRAECGTFHLAGSGSVNLRLRRGNRATGGQARQARRSSRDRSI